jgi:hypothetical protein
MRDKYKELTENLSIIINLLKDFNLTKDDYKKPDIRAYQVKISSLAKIINNKILEDFKILDDIVDEYLANPIEDNYLKVIDSATKLQNDLWEF